MRVYFGQCRTCDYTLIFTLYVIEYKYEVAINI